MHLVGVLSLGARHRASQALHLHSIFVGGLSSRIGPSGAVVVTPWVPFLLRSIRATKSPYAEPSSRFRHRTTVSRIFFTVRRRCRCDSDLVSCSRTSLR